ncbi:MAG: amidohydrolase family protein [archaeon GB-1867-035]|nr:amidohydrolase family protein [Candidatus Culexmicrobium profundum]
MSYLALVNGCVIDGTGRPVLEKGGVVIKDDIIVEVGDMDAIEIPKEVKVIDVEGKTIMPGLIDAHIHLTGLRTGDLIREPLLTPYATLVARAIRDLEALINAGFTTMGDAGSIIALQLKRAEREGTIVSPRIVAAGYTLSQTFGHGDQHFLPIEYVDARTTKMPSPLSSLICDGVDECRKAARYALRAGADFIKIMATGGVMSEKDRPEYTQFTLEEIEAIVEEARHAHRFVHAHAQGTEGIINALKAGVKVIAHGIFIDEEGMELAKKKNAVVVPTLSIVEQILMYGKELGIPEWGLRKSKEVHEIHIANIRKAYEAGVKIATGTDFLGGVKAFRYGDNSLELQLLVEKVGMPPMDAIIAATRNAAEAVGLERKIGTLEKNKVADLIVVNGNPLEDIKVLRKPENIVIVMKEGKLVKNML